MGHARSSTLDIDARYRPMHAADILEFDLGVQDREQAVVRTRSRGALVAPRAVDEAWGVLHLAPTLKARELGAMHLAKQPPSRRPRAASTTTPGCPTGVRGFPLLLVILGAQEGLVLLRVVGDIIGDVDPAAVVRWLGLGVGRPRCRDRARNVTREREGMCGRQKTRESHRRGQTSCCDASSS
jgi:hypothetical protein